jgi:hypothetical protein
VHEVEAIHKDLVQKTRVQKTKWLLYWFHLLLMCDCNYSKKDYE